MPSSSSSSSSCPSSSLSLLPGSRYVSARSHLLSEASCNTLSPYWPFLFILRCDKFLAYVFCISYSSSSLLEGKSQGTVLPVLNPVSVTNMLSIPNYLWNGDRRGQAQVTSLVICCAARPGLLGSLLSWCFWPLTCREADTPGWARVGGLPPLQCRATKEAQDSPSHLSITHCMSEIVGPETASLPCWLPGSHSLQGCSTPFPRVSSLQTSLACKMPGGPKPPCQAGGEPAASLTASLGAPPSTAQLRASSETLQVPQWSQLTCSHPGFTEGPSLRPRCRLLRRACSGGTFSCHSRCWIESCIPGQSWGCWVERDH